jgi:hypothetical protein
MYHICSQSTFLKSIHISDIFFLKNFAPLIAKLSRGRTIEGNRPHLRSLLWLKEAAAECSRIWVHVETPTSKMSKKLATLKLWNKCMLT